MIHEAIIFAACAHEGQKRKGTNVPYIVHPFEVAQILTDAGGSESLVCAGLLHDTVEDTGVTLEEIQSKFGGEVAALVGLMTEEKSLSWEDRKQQAIDAVDDAMSREAKMLVCADKLSNLRSIQRDMDAIGESVWSRFRRGKEKQKWYYGTMIERLSCLETYPMYGELKKLFSQVFEGERN